MSTADAVARFFRAVDRRDWAAVRAGLADEVATDYSSLFGTDPEQVAGDDLVAQWQGMLPGFDSTQHFLGPLVAGDDGTLECNVRGYHHLGEETWMVAGWYVLTVAGDGRLAGITLHASYETGDRGLVEKASARAGGA